VVIQQLIATSPRASPINRLYACQKVVQHVDALVTEGLLRGRPAAIVGDPSVDTPGVQHLDDPAEDDTLALAMAIWGDDRHRQAA
jgi:hypothetical protein